MHGKVWFEKNRSQDREGLVLLSYELTLMRTSFSMMTALISSLISLSTKPPSSRPHLLMGPILLALCQPTEDWTLSKQAKEIITKKCCVILKKAQGDILDYQTLKEVQLEKSTMSCGYRMIALKQKCDKTVEATCLQTVCM